MNILLICREFPFPPMTGSRQRYFALIKYLSRYHRIYVLSIIRSPHEKEYIPEIEKYCQGVDTAILEKKMCFRTILSVLSSMAQGLPLYNALMTSPELKKKIFHLCQAWCIDIVQIEHSYMGHYIQALPPGISCIKVLTYDDIVSIQSRRIFRIEKNILVKFGHLLNSIMMRSYEVKIGSQFDICLTVSLQDKATLERKNPHLPITYLPNGTDTTAYTPLPLDAAAKDIIFVGTFRYTPNVDAVLYFYRHMFREIVNVLPDTEFWIVGPDPPPAVTKLARDPHVTVTGYVSDLIPYYRKAGVAIAPLRAGSGTRLKILEAMALGRPVVSTSIGCEGLDVMDGEHILIADRPNTFASSCIRVLSNHTLKQHIAANARQIVEKNYSWESIIERLMSLYTGIEKRKRSTDWGTGGSKGK